MNIILTSNSSFNLYNFRKDLIINLKSKNHKIIILSSKDKYTKYLKELGCEFVDLKINTHSLSVFKNLSLFLKYIFYIYIYKPKYIFSYTIKPNIFCSLISLLFFLRFKVVLTITGLGTIFTNNNFFYLILRFIYILTSKISYHCFFHNQYDLNLFSKKKHKNFSVIPGSGVDLNYFQFSKMIEEFSCVNFLFIGRIIREKGVIELLEAAKKLKLQNFNFKLHLIGELSPNNPNTLNVDNFYKSIDNEYIFYSKSEFDVRKYIIKSDCIILPSYREGMPKSLLESSSMGRPILGSNTTGINELIIDNFNGLLFEPKNIDSLFMSMKKFILLSKADKHKMSLNARMVVEKQYSVENVVDKYVKLIN